MDATSTFKDWRAYWIAAGFQNAANSSDYDLCFWAIRAEPGDRYAAFVRCECVSGDCPPCNGQCSQGRACPRHQGPEPMNWRGILIGLGVIAAVLLALALVACGGSDEPIEPDEMKTIGTPVHPPQCQASGVCT